MVTLPKGDGLDNNLISEYNINLEEHLAQLFCGCKHAYAGIKINCLMCQERVQ